MSRGYTLWELVAATTLTLFVTLGGVTALQVRAKGERRADALRQALHVVKRADAELQKTPADPCAVHHALPGEKPADCLAPRSGKLPGGTPYHLTLERRPALPGTVVARLVFMHHDVELLRHDLIIPVGDEGRRP
ncbi:MAG: hypothetical protein AB2A00_22190 [Myxococcota bacterium]